MFHTACGILLIVLSKQAVVLLDTARFRMAASTLVIPVPFSLSQQIAGKVAAPLARTNEIVILSGENSRVTGEVNRLLAELPVSVNALTGVDLTQVRRTRKHYVCSC